MVSGYVQKGVSMDGMEVIDEILVRELPLANAIPCFVLFFIMLFIFFGVSIWEFCNAENKGQKLAAVVWIFINIVIAIGMPIDLSKQYNNTHVEYIIKAPENISAADFLSKYKVIEEVENGYRIEEK